MKLWPTKLSESYSNWVPIFMNVIDIRYEVDTFIRFYVFVSTYIKFWPSVFFAEDFHIVPLPKNDKALKQ